MSGGGKKRVRKALTGNPSPTAVQVSGYPLQPSQPLRQYIQTENRFEFDGGFLEDGIAHANYVAFNLLGRLLEVTP